MKLSDKFLIIIKIDKGAMQVNLRALFWNCFVNTKHPAQHTVTDLESGHYFVNNLNLNLTKTISLF